MPPSRPDVLVLAGGRSARLGQDKAAVRVGGLTLLDRVLRAAGGVGGGLVVAGPERPLAAGTPAPVWCGEDPPGGGPVAGVAAGLRHVRADRVLVLAVDLPFLTAEALSVLLDAGAAAVAVDADGRDQHLLGCWPTDRLRAEIPEHPAGRSWRSVVAGLGAARVRLPGQPPPETDCDTAADLARARAASAAAAAGDDTDPVGTPGDTTPGTTPGRATGDTGPDALDAWVARVRSGLDLPDVDATALLDLARDVAHGVARPAAPLTTFLAGLAAGRAGGQPADVAAVVARIRELLAADRADGPDRADRADGP